MEQAVFDEAGSAAREDRNFRMHPALLWSVIQSQAGTPEKALLEAIMNAVDANASRCDIVIDEKGYRISDTGRGFRNRAEIEEFFETFGTPHKAGDATYGRFRMGRGQLFAFSTTMWRSGTFQMMVDIKGRGLSYELLSDLLHTPGCTITGEWYERMDKSEVIRVVHDLTQLAQWMQIEVTVNGRQINKTPADQKWSLETDDAYISLKAAGGLAVYNLGALVRVYPPHQFGVSGIIVTKNQLQVNFARNDILLSECTVWKRIRRELDVICGNLVKKKSLSNYERDAIAIRFVRGEVAFDDIVNLGLVVDVSGKKRSLAELASAARLCVVPDHKDWTIGEQVMHQKLAFVVRAETLHRFGAETVEELISILKRQVDPSDEDRIELARLAEQAKKLQEATRIAYKPRGKQTDEYHRLWEEQRVVDRLERKILDNYPHRGRFDGIEAVTLAEISAHVNDTYELVDHSKLPPHQKAMLTALQGVSKALAQRMSWYLHSLLHQGGPVEALHRSEYDVQARQVVLGKSDVADAWTDGKTFIAINVELLARLLDNRCSLLDFIVIMVHEYCHNEPDQGGHVHDADFYEMFHNLLCSRLGVLDAARWHLLEGYSKAVAFMDKKPKAHLMTKIRNDSKHLGDDFDAAQGVKNAE